MTEVYLDLIVTQIIYIIIYNNLRYVILNYKKKTNMFDAKFYQKILLLLFYYHTQWDLWDLLVPPSFTRKNFKSYKIDILTMCNM